MKFVFLFIVFALIRSVYALITKGTSVVGGYGCGDDDNDIVTDPTYSVLDCNIFHEDNIFDD